MELQVCLPARNGGVLELGVDLLEELRLGHVDGGLRDLRLVEVLVPVDVRGELLELRVRRLVLGRRGVGGDLRIQRRLGEPLLEREDGVGRLTRSRVRRSAELQHLRHVRAVRLAELGGASIRLEVGVAIAEAKRAGDDVREEVGRFAVLVGAGDAEGDGDRDLV